MSNIQIFNTLSRKKEPFTPLKEREVNMYVCGVTVYDETHLGHARAYVAFDIINRYLTYRGYHVKYVRNVTDIDDKIIVKAQQLSSESDSIKEKTIAITKKYYQYFIENMDKLNILRPTLEPKATEHIPEIIDIIKKLEENDLAYAEDSDVFFKVDNFPSYGKLSKKNLDELEVGSRVGVNEKKKNPLDFVLWKKAKPGEPSWDSPWGKGRPGWHIECSAMSVKYLGESFDIHGGGEDLIFPHHENEIAQSEGAFKKTFVKYWIHNGFVTINKEKMSKSLGNFFALKDLFQKYEPRFIRFFLISQKYRTPLDFSFDSINSSKEALQRIDNCVGMIEEKLKEKEIPHKNLLNEQALENFHKAMDDDFNTSAALAEVFNLVNKLNTQLKEDSIDENSDQNLNSLKEICQVLGIIIIPVKLKKVSSDTPNEEPISNLKERSDDILNKEELSDEDLETLITIRLQARKNKDFATADKIRNLLLEKKITLRDTPTGTEWIKE